jgi:hypothetical protein
MSIVGRPRRSAPWGSRSRPDHGWSGRSGVERTTALACLTLAVFVGVRAESLVSQSTLAQSGAFPPHGVLWLGAGILGLASLVWVIQLLRETPPHSTDVAKVREVLPVFSVLIGGAWAAQWLGLLLAAGLTYVALLLYYRDQSRIFIAVSVVAYMGLLHYGMEVLLKVPLAKSPLFQLPF